MAEGLICADLRVPHCFGGRGGLTADDVLPGGVPVRLRQVHSARVVEASAPFETPPEADALVTRTAGLVLEIVTADCAPVLLADADAGVVGAAHAGWRGALAGVLGETVAAMATLGAEPGRIVAAIGPCIAPQSYEVDAAMRDRFPERAGRWFAPAERAGHFRFDLPGFVRAELIGAGVGAVHDLRQDTYSQPARFHSFRRATHQGEPTGGRQQSLVALAPCT